MKVVLVFILLFAAVLCRPARKFSDSSAESSEEVVRRPGASLFRKQMAELTRFRVAPFRLFQRFLAPIVAGSDESTDGSDEQAAVESPSLVNFETTDDVAIDTPSIDNQDEPTEDSNDDDDDDVDDDDDESEESESEEEDEEDSSESGESSTVAPETVTPVIVTEEPLFETTEEPLVPTIVTDTDSGRGDSMGRYPSEYKSYVYGEEKTYHKASSPYKSYEYVESGKKSGYDMPVVNEVEKSPEMYKSETYQEHSDLTEEETSTPENQDVLPEEEEGSDSGSSADVEEEEEESEPEQSSEEATATPGAADSDSDESDSMESDSDEHGMEPESTTDIPVVITAK
ncbi:osteopontin [Syngnathoides biaculeatus]|uniref:osteopontin n=1 Tax=Syngnathoides biaculeatus TaxID=300417 RepID=UPI002ADE7454|nr:osteopontin [Syngnathoides biaculeatus]